MAESSGNSGLGVEKGTPSVRAQATISAEELSIFQQAASDNEGVTVSVLAKEGEDYLPTKPTWVEAERSYKGPLKVKPGEIYIQISSSKPDLSIFWTDVKRLRKESADPAK